MDKFDVIRHLKDIICYNDGSAPVLKSELVDLVADITRDMPAQNCSPLTISSSNFPKIQTIKFVREFLNGIDDFGNPRLSVRQREDTNDPYVLLTLKNAKDLVDVLLEFLAEKYTP